MGLEMDSDFRHSETQSRLVDCEVSRGVEEKKEKKKKKKVKVPFSTEVVRDTVNVISIASSDAPLIDDSIKKTMKKKSKIVLAALPAMDVDSLGLSQKLKKKKKY